MLIGILWVLRSALERFAAALSPASDLSPLVPDLGPTGEFKHILTELGEDLYQRGASIFGKPLSMTVSTPQKKGGIVSALQSVARDEGMAIADASGFPVAIDIPSPSPHEVKIVETTIESRFISQPPERIIGDKAYDSDPLDESLRQQYGTELIGPHKTNRKKPKTQDGLVLKPYRSDGKWNVCSLGCIISEDWLLVGNIMLIVFSACCN